MVTRSVTLLSFLLPIAMSLGTGLAIIFYKYSQVSVLIFGASGGLLLCVYIIIIRSESKKRIG